MSSLLEELNKNKAIEDAVQPNKMSKFAYTEKAYEDNNASGVDSFDFEAEQNIPSDKLTVLQTNETVILKGFRAQASSVTRQLLNHFFGRASYNLNKVHDVVKGVLDAFVNFIGKANGVATLDENGRIPYSQLPESAMEFKGTWDASTNTPTLVDGTGDTGDFYVVSVAGTQDLGSGEIKFLENDRVIYSEGVWSKLSAGDVRTINNIQPTDGNVTLTGDNINISASDTTKVSTKVTSHINATTGVHGAVSTATANKIAIRDASGRLQVANPSNALDATNKQTVVSLINNLAVQIWTAISDTKFGTTRINSVTYGNGKFVAVGGSGKGAYSSNGINWTAISGTEFGTSIINSVTYGNDKFVAVGDSGKGAYSSDGINWTAISNTKFGTSIINSVTYGNGKFVVVGGEISPTLGLGSYSSNGINWTAISDMKFGTSIINSVTYGNGKFVAVGGRGKGAYSSDGINWTAISDTKFGTSNINSVIYVNGKFVAVGGSGKGAYSSDGINWTAISDMKFGTSIINSGTYGNGKFVVVGDSGKGAYSSDGINWTAISDTKFGTSSINSVIYVNGKFVVVGDSGKGAFSQNLLN